MFEISFNDLAISVVSFTLVILGFFQFGRISATLQRKRKARREVIQCSVCGNLYKDTTGERVVECPECGRANRRGRDRSLG